MPLESCTMCHGASKSYRDPKTVDYSPQKRPEMPEITSFDDAARVVYLGNGASKTSRDPKTVDYSPRKRPEMAEIMSFYDFVKLLIRGPDCLNPPRTPKPCAIAQENGQK